MSPASDRKGLFVLLSVLTFVICGTYITVTLGRGYRLSFTNGPQIQATGILSVTSSPKSASVYLDNRLITATDDVLNLIPGDYQIKIAKDGYLPWAKVLTIKKEIVTTAASQLFRSAPNLKPVTFVGAINPTVSPDNTKIVFAVASASATKDNGLYLLESSNLPLPLNRHSLKQLSPDLSGVNWSKYKFTFSPDSKTLLATSAHPTANFLITTDSPINPNKLYDITSQLPFIKSDWQNIEQRLLDSKLARLPQSLKAAVSTQSSNFLQFSSDESKILYLANKKTDLLPVLLPPPPSQNSLPQQRQLEADSYYVYDLKNDTNYHLGKSNQYIHLFWLPNSDNLILATPDTIFASDSDASNRQILFKGQFSPSVLATTTDGLDLIILISPYTTASENLYAITIR